MTDAQQRPPRTTLFWRTAITITIGVDLVLIGILSVMPGQLGVYETCPTAPTKSLADCTATQTNLGAAAIALIVVGAIVAGYFLYRAIRAWRIETAAASKPQS
jgi:hypothetical protein